MAPKLFILVVLALACATLNGMVDVVIQQPVSATLAVDQLADDEVAAATMRSYSSLMNLLPIVSWGSVALIGLAMFRRDVVRVVKSALNPEDGG